VVGGDGGLEWCEWVLHPQDKPQNGVCRTAKSGSYGVAF
jgi:hypothetical protein